MASVWGGPKHRVLGLVLGGAFLGLTLGSIGLRVSIVWVTVVVFLGMLVLPTLDATSRALWLAKAEPDLQGRGYSPFFVVVGLVVLVASAAAWAYPPLRNLERGVPDAVQDPKSSVTENPGV